LMFFVVKALITVSETLKPSPALTSVGSAVGSIEDQQWYHGMLPREDINRLLKEDGEFLVRVTEPTPSSGMRTVISTRWNGRHYHFIVGHCKGMYYVEKETFPDVVALVEYYHRQKKPLTEATGAKLLSPVKRQKWELRHEWIKLDRQLGEGAFGGVFAGTLTTGFTTRKVAVKVNKGKAVEKEVIEEMCKEAAIMRIFRHPNVVKFYGIAVEREPVMLVMELVEGGSLDIVLRTKKEELTVQDLTNFALGAAKGLEYLHSKNCIHRDVAARNCLVSGKEDVNQRLPIRWIAPEVLETMLYSTKSDVYSFGILLWEIFSEGNVPYGKMTLAEVKTQIRSRQFVFNGKFHVTISDYYAEGVRC
uniref:Tyrosine-protein kinase n=1 Tax=Heligmosomoides polygyrus TaxID=6339 RepID=A0A8L8JYR0_HELPZ